MLGLIAASGFFLAIHLLIAGTSIRDSLVRLAGESAYLGLFSVASLLGIVWMCLAYNEALLQAPELLWDAGLGLRHAGGIVVAIAFFFVVPGLLTANPTSVRQEGAIAKPETIQGMLRITRHPFLWGVAIWAAFHLAINGDAPSTVFFGAFLALAVFGTVSIDARRKKKLGAEWETFSAKTSNIPFAAILTGKNSLRISELLTYRQLLAFLAFTGFILTHHWLFKVSPFPGGWVPF